MRYGLADVKKNESYLRFQFNFMKGKIDNLIEQDNSVDLILSEFPTLNVLIFSIHILSR